MGRRAQVSELISAVWGASRFSQSPPTTAAAPQPPAPGVTEPGNGCGWRIQMLPSCVPVAAVQDAASVRRRPLPAAGFVRPPPRPAPRRASPPPPRSHFLGAGGGSAPGSEGLSRRAWGAEGSGGERSSVLRPPQRKKKCPPEETHKFYRGDRQPARGATGGQAREAPEPRGRKRSRGPETTEPPAARGGKPEPALPAKVNFNRGGWMQSPGGR